VSCLYTFACAMQVAACEKSHWPLSDVQVLWTYMLAGRWEKESEFHPYLAALPQYAPDPCSWSAELQTDLTGTRVGEAVQQCLKELADFVVSCETTCVNLNPDDLEHKAMLVRASNVPLLMYFLLLITGASTSAICKRA
jgi:hypothetical protein